MIKDYRIYSMSRKEIISCFLEAVALDGLLSFLFYDSFWAMIPGVGIFFIYFKEKIRQLMRKRFLELRHNLKDFLNTLIAVLQTGRSLENAFLEALKDMEGYLGKETVFLKEIRKICAGVSVGEPLEKLLLDFAYRSHLEELEYFAEVFMIGKRTGDVVGIMKNTIRMIQERMEAEEEIYTVLAEKRMEFYLMCIIPLGIMIYLRISAGNLMDSLYGNITGITIMTICLLVYGGCYLYGKRLLEVENG